MPDLSAGLLLFRRDFRPTSAEIEVLLVHPGGPFWRNKDEHAWSVPKGLVDPEEDPEAAARREFEEELGQATPEGELVELGTFEQNRRKTVRAWMLEGDLDVSIVESNEFEMEWPPKSGRLQSFPEVDRAEWFPLEVAYTKIHKGQIPILDVLAQKT